MGRLTPCRPGQCPGLTTVIGPHRPCVRSHDWESTVHWGGDWAWPGPSSLTLSPGPHCGQAPCLTQDCACLLVPGVWELWGVPDSQGSVSYTGLQGCFFQEAAWFLFKRRNIQIRVLLLFCMLAPCGSWVLGEKGAGGRGVPPSEGSPQTHSPGVRKAGCMELAHAPCQITVGTLATNTTAPLPGSYSWSVSPFGGEGGG